MKQYKIMARDGATCELLGSTIFLAPDLPALQRLGDLFREDILCLPVHLIGEPDDVYWDYEEVKTDVKGK